MPCPRRLSKVHTYIAMWMKAPSDLIWLFRILVFVKSALNGKGSTLYARRRPIRVSIRLE